jgi:hypothetical protein
VHASQRLVVVGFQNAYNSQINPAFRADAGLQGGDVVKAARARGMLNTPAAAEKDGNRNDQQRQGDENEQKEDSSHIACILEKDEAGEL